MSVNYRIMGEKGQLEIGQRYTITIMGQFKTDNAEDILNAGKLALAKAFPQQKDKVKLIDGSFEADFADYKWFGITYQGYKDVKFEFVQTENFVLTAAVVAKIIALALALYMISPAVVHVRKAVKSAGQAIERVASTGKKVIDDAADFTEKTSGFLGGAGGVVIIAGLVYAFTQG